ncbi:hypothetical protein BURK1_02002 [Burkholderiales bacterium]|nr:hypothetical protein BURK1_02002 [Burkholderiales bacterium]
MTCRFRTMRKPDIRCPACRWRPGAEARWTCLPACGTVWNTFSTGGRCPGCGARWHRTQCLACGVVSPHRDWYRDPDSAGGTTGRRELVTAR